MIVKDFVKGKDEKAFYTEVWKQCRQLKPFMGAMRVLGWRGGPLKIVRGEFYL
jgi:hypothetical protein